MIVNFNRYGAFPNVKRKTKNIDPLFAKARFNITKQRLMSLNRGALKKLGTGKGFVDDSFHIQMSRGYCNVVPVKRGDSHRLDQHGPFLKGSKYSMFLGNSKAYYWRGRSVIFPMSYCNIIAWYLSIIPEKFREDWVSVDSAFCANPSYINSFLTLTGFSKDNEGYRGYVPRKLLNVDRYLDRLMLPTNIPPAEKSDVYYAKVTLGTHPGIITRKLAERVQRKNTRKVKRVSKSNLLIWVVNDLLSKWDAISSGKIGKTIGTYCVGSREKIQRVDIGEAVQSRPLWIPEMSDVILGSTWLEKFKEYWERGSLFKSEIWLGHSDTKMRYLRRVELDVEFKYSYEFDGQVWDSSVPKELIIKAFNIFASSFAQDKAVVNHFKFLCDTFVMKRVILHNGNTFLVNHGVPSGHAWTSHINSMANWILWTSTIHNCPHIPKEVRSDYRLQIMGDDVCLHSNAFLSADVRKLIATWMLKNFNYRVVDDTRVADKSLVKNDDDGSSFLKRYCDQRGNLTTKEKDIWKKLIFGADYSGTRKSRLTYLLRRINDLAIINPKQRRSVSIFLAYTEFFESRFYNLSFNERLRRHHIIYQILFVFTDGFTRGVEDVWQKFAQLFNFSFEKFQARVDYYEDHIQRIYAKNYWTYDSKRMYVDYWAERKLSTTVSKALKNVKEPQLFSTISLINKLHGPFKKKRG